MTKYRVTVLQLPVQPNDLGEMTETELYGYLGVRLEEGEDLPALTQLPLNGTVVVKSQNYFNLETRIRITRL